MRAQGRHKSANVLPRYAKRTMRQVAKRIRKRHAERTKSGQTSELIESVFDALFIDLTASYRSQQLDDQLPQSLVGN
jgi:hypothetical protein